MKYALERGDAFRSKYDIRDISNLAWKLAEQLVWLKGYAKSLHKTAATIDCNVVRKALFLLAF